MNCNLLYDLSSNISCCFIMFMLHNNHTYMLWALYYSVHIICHYFGIELFLSYLGFEYLTLTTYTNFTFRVDLQNGVTTSYLVVLSIYFAALFLFFLDLYKNNHGIKLKILTKNNKYNQKNPHSQQLLKLPKYLNFL